MGLHIQHITTFEGRRDLYLVKYHDPVDGKENGMYVVADHWRSAAEYVQEAIHVAGTEPIPLNKLIANTHNLTDDRDDDVIGGVYGEEGENWIEFDKRTSDFDNTSDLDD